MWTYDPMPPEEVRLQTVLNPVYLLLHLSGSPARPIKYGHGSRFLRWYGIRA